MWGVQLLLVIPSWVGQGGLLPTGSRVFRGSSLRALTFLFENMVPPVRCVQYSGLGTNKDDNGEGQEQTKESEEGGEDISLTSMVQFVAGHEFCAYGNQRLGGTEIDEESN